MNVDHFSNLPVSVETEFSPINITQKAIKDKKQRVLTSKKKNRPTVS